MLRELISGGFRKTVLHRSERMETLIEALSVGLGFSVEASVVKTVRRGALANSNAVSQQGLSSKSIEGCPNVNMMYFESTMVLYSSMILQMFLCRNETEVS